jgi:DNA-directed RNA polymerase subunit RPC12/RpoP
MADVLTHICPNCGGPLTFDPKDQLFHCEYCLSKFTEQEVTDFEEKQKAAKLDKDANDTATTAQADATESPTADTPTDEASDSSSESDMGVFVCPSCGAQIVTDANTAATYCYFCHNPVVLSERLSGKYLPDKVLPFQIEKKEATEQFIEWTKKKHYVPNAFFNEKQIEKLTGVYFPYWVIDSETSGTLQANGTNIRVWVAGDVEFTETKQYNISRSGKMTFSNLIKNALSKNAQQKMVAGVQPFDLSKSTDFKSQYLSGFQAEKRDIEMTDLAVEVNKELTNYSKSLLQGSVNGYTTVTNVRTNIQKDKEEDHYVLLPLWLVTYKNAGSDKVYYYAMNGQTGKISGILPISKGKLALHAILIFAVLAIIFLIVGYFL